VDHVVIRIGQLEKVYGTVESTPGGKLRYESDTAEQLDVLVDLIAEYNDLQDPWDGARYRELQRAEFLRRLARRCKGASPYSLWCDVLEDSLYPEPGDGAH
jgi:hypothetical protein